MHRGNQPPKGLKRGPKLKLIHLQFILEYIKNGNNGAKAYATVTGETNPKKCAANANTWLNNPLVKAEIAKVMDKAIKLSGISAEYVLSSLKEVADACKKKKVGVDANGNLIEAGVMDSSGACRSLELLGKNLKLWSESLDVHLKKEYDELSDEELLEIIKNSKKQEDANNK